MLPMTSYLDSEVSALIEKGRISEAYNLLTQTELNGDGRAALMLGDMRLSGQVIRRDLAEAQRRYAAAAALGEPEGVGPAIALLAAGPANVERDWQAALTLLKQWAERHAQQKTQHDLLTAMDIDREGDPNIIRAPEMIKQAPSIARYNSFLNRAECAYLMTVSKPNLQPSVIVDPNTGKLFRDPIRSGSTAFFGLVLENPVLHAINRRIARASETMWEQGEPAQVIAYDQGQEYKLHSDALPAGQPQRIKTMLIALNDNYVGGSTSFPQLKLDIRLKTGDALMFENVDADGKPASIMRHAGLPVTRGRKFLLSRWIRERPLDLSGPPGRPF